MLATAADIVWAARSQLQDARKAYWSDDELRGYVNSGRTVLFSVKPGIYEATEAVTLVQGFRQGLPNGSNLLFRPLDNLSNIGQRAITTIDGQLLARSRPRWRTMEPTDEIVHVMYDIASPKVYECYPPAKAGTQIRISYAKPPVGIEASAMATVLEPEGVHADALVDYCLHRAFAKQSDTSPDAGQMSGDYLKIFMNKITGEEQSQSNRSTNATTRGMRPSGGAQ